MQLYSPGVLILLLRVFSTGSGSAVPTVKVELHDSATLPCSERCPGVVRWTMFHKPTEVLAECDQTSCRSVKEGYQMIHDQYLKGDLSLTITDAGLRKKARYTCDCDGDSELCDVELQVEHGDGSITCCYSAPPGSESADPPVMVKLHDSATLPCSKRCSGVVRWSESSNPTEVLAECNQTSCRSVKEGYQMIHDQYLKRNFSLTITDADLSKRGLYTCTCGGSEVCDVELQVERDEPEGEETNPSRRRSSPSDCRPCGKKNKEAGQSESVTPVLVVVAVVVAVAVAVVVAIVVAVVAVLFVKRQKRNHQLLQKSPKSKQDAKELQGLQPPNDDQVLSAA